MNNYNEHQHQALFSVTACQLPRYSHPPQDRALLPLSIFLLISSTLSAMDLSSWFSNDNTKKNMHVKIVHPGGRVELHDRPVLAAEIMQRNSKCCIAYPTVFQQPWSAIVAPETTLMLGQKFYVVPMSTIRKLQRLSPRNSFPLSDRSPSTHVGRDAKKDAMIDNGRCFFVNKNTPRPSEKCGARKREKEKENGRLREDNCFMCLFPRIKINDNRDGPYQETRPAMNVGSCESKKDGGTRKRSMESTTNKGKRGSPRSRRSFDHWQPSLESIDEE